MAIEGMVDALRRASRWMRRDGCVIDVHPTKGLPAIEAGGQTIGHVETPDGPARHAAADAAVRDAIASGLFIATASERFEFSTWGDTLAELRDHIEENWVDARVVIHQPASGRVRAIEHVQITKLVWPRPLA